MATSATLVPRAGALVDVSAGYSVSSSDPLSTDDEVIADEIYNVLSTRIGDEPEEATYGSNLPLYTFEHFTARVEQRALLDVFNALKRNVPQVYLSMGDTALLVSPDNRIVGIAVGIKMGDRFFTVNIDLAGAYNQ